uniref:Uncharacterized protein n=1 Tax=Arundo donax TaxID=35708 RepID=A0A0A9H3Y9_ARUDO
MDASIGSGYMHQPSFVR